MSVENKTALPEEDFIIGEMPRVSPVITVSCCLAMSVLYVASLYIWNTEHGRDHPSTVKRRSIGVSLVMMISPVFLYIFSSSELLQKVPFHELLGLRLSGLLMAIVVPYFLTMLLFIGPLCVELENESLKALLESEYWRTSIKDMQWLRNHIIAPLSEEFVFRACMMPLLLQSFSPITAVFIAPLFFGVAHIHHIVERLHTGMALNMALLESLCQLTYTTIFGFYSAYLFVRTGHFISPVLAHAFCNHMGLPDVRELWQLQSWKRIIFMIWYVVGLIAWIFLLPIATNPSLYNNTIFWSQKE